MGSLGDVTRGFSLLTPLKQELKGCSITWLVEPKCEGIVRLHPLIDHIIVFDRSKSIKALPQLIKNLRTEKFDVVLDLQRHFKSGFFSWMARGKRSIGFNPKNTKELNHLFHKEHIQYFPETAPKIDNYQAFLKALGLTSTNQTLTFGLKTTQRGVRPNIPTAPLTIGVLLGSSWPSKDIPPQGYQQIIEKIFAHYSTAQVVLLGDKSHTQLAVKLTNAIQSDRLTSSAGKTDLVGLVSVLSECTLVVGPDSGPGHICSALDTPYVSLFGPTDPQRVAPAGNEDRVVRASVGCSPCWRRECPGLDKICMRLILIDDVMACIGKTLYVSNKN
jgi:ADP-heptose:LPS heptosyltransferase